MIIKIRKSPVKHKRYRVYMDTGKHYDFGLDTGKTYINEGNKDKRYNYWKRHLANETELELIYNLVPSPSLFSAYLLWGSSTDLKKNVETLNKLWLEKHEKNLSKL